MKTRNTWLILIGVILCAGIYTKNYLHEAWLNRKVDILSGKGILKEELSEYLEHGTIPKSHNPDYYEVWHSTNVVAISSVKYQCCIAGRFGNHFGSRTLAVTTNGVFILFGEDQSPRIIGPDYSPRYFPPDF